MNSTDLVFVYGSLKKGEGNHRLISHCDLVGKGKIKGTMIAYSRWFPGVCAVGDDDVHGEVYSVDNDTLAMLDRLEGHPTHYKRQQAVAFHENNYDGELVWCYFLPDQLLQEGHYNRIPSGEWRKHA